MRARPLARRERRARTADVIRTEPELREQRPGVDPGQALCAPSARRRGERRPEYASRPWPIAPMTVRRPTTRCPPTRPVPSTMQPEQRRLPGPVRAGDREPLARGEVEVDRTETKRAALRNRAREPQHEVRGTRSPRQREVELPGLERLRTAARCARGAARSDAPSSAARGWRDDPGRRSCRPGTRPCLVPRSAACSGAV